MIKQTEGVRTLHTMIKAFEERLPAMLKDLETITMIESPSNDRESTNRLATKMAEMWSEIGFDVERVPGGEYGDHIVARYGTSGPQVLLVGHMDTVFGVGETARRPFAIRGDRVLGPGVYDMKCGIIMALHACAYLVEQGLLKHKRVCVICNSDEEIGSPTSRDVIISEARKSQWALIFEPSIGQNGHLKTARRGVGFFRVDVEGRPSHAGSEHSKGVSATAEIAKIITDIHGLTDYQIGTTTNVGVIGGGTRPNVVAAHAFAEIDVRVSTMREAERVEKFIYGLKPQHKDARVSVTGGYNRPPMEPTPANRALFEKAREVGKDLGLDLEGGPTGAGSDGNLTSPEVATLDGLGAFGDGSHTDCEYVLIEHLPVRTALAARLIQVLGT